MDFERSHRHFKEINLTALIDVVFHLMVFVMLTTSFVVSESMELSLPSGQPTVTSAVDAQVTRIRIVSDGSVVVEEQPMRMDGLSGVLAARLASDPDTRIAIFTTPGVSVQQLVQVMDTVYLMGGRNVQVDRLI